MTFEDILEFMKNLHLDNVSVHRYFFFKSVINECARKKKAKILESRYPRVFWWDIEQLMFLKRRQAAL